MTVMMDWFRSHHGAPTDPKWRTIAKRAGVAPGVVVSIAWALLDIASQHQDRGSIAGADVETLADFMGYEVDAIERVIAAMTDKGVLTDMRFTAWDRRQVKREDLGAAARKRGQRERERAEKASAARDADEPDQADPDSGDNDIVTPCHAPSRAVPKASQNVTTDKNRTEQIRSETLPATAAVEPRAPAATAAPPPPSFENRCRKLVGQEPVAVEPDFGPILRLLDETGLTEGDVIAGIEAGLAKADPTFRFRTWRNFEGWIRGAAKDRIGEGKRAASKPPKPAPLPDDPNDPLVDLKTGFKRRWSDIRKACDAYRENSRSWRFEIFGWEPDKPECRLPEEILVEKGFRPPASGPPPDGPRLVYERAS